MKNSIYDELNERQKEAVKTIDGPLLILAGPGSGKTKTLTARIAHLLAAGVPPERILALTFTNKAAGEMRERIVQLVKDDRAVRNGRIVQNNFNVFNGFNDFNRLFIGTFHSFAVRILRAHAPKLGYSPHFSIFDEDDALGIIKEVMKEANINTKQFPPGMIRTIISGLKNELVAPERYADETGLTDMFPKTVHRVYEAYERRLKESNGMDFDGLLTNLSALFEKHSAILGSYQEQFLYIHVDEYQDTNHAQYVLITYLAGKHGNIAVVGDDAQAIYGFRGADFRNILHFEKDWPNAKIVVLDENYRSTQTILDAARGVISKNTLQKEKRLWTKKEGGDPIELHATEDERGEAEFVSRAIQHLLREGKRVSDIAILYRTNAQSRALEEALLEENIPYAIIGGIKFYERKEIKDILAYLRVCTNPDDRVSLKRIINTPARGIGKAAFLSYLAQHTKGGSTPPSKHDPALNRFDALMEDLRSALAERKPSDGIKYLLKKIRYKEYLEDGTTNADERWENTEEFVSLAARYNDLAPLEGIQKLLEDAALITEADTKEAPNAAIKMMTVHAAKGLEFPIVFLVGLEEGIFPHSKSLFSPRDLEEERRLCYVGLTRAKEKVFLSFALRRMRFGSIEVNPPSRFLSEIPEDLIRVSESEIEEVTID